MKTTLPLSLALTGALITPLHAEEELAPPDVDFFVQAQMSKADMDPYGFDTADGLTINVGMWLNSVTLGENSRFGLEGGFVTQGDVDELTDFTRAPRSRPVPRHQRHQQEDSVELLPRGLAKPYWLY